MTPWAADAVCRKMVRGLRHITGYPKPQSGRPKTMRVRYIVMNPIGLNRRQRRAWT